MADRLLPHSDDFRLHHLLGTLSILSTFVDRKGHAAHWCARAWSWLILATTGVEVTVKRARAREARIALTSSCRITKAIYDIPVIFASLPFQLRIIAKESLGDFRFSDGTSCGADICSSTDSNPIEPVSCTGGAGWSPIGSRSSSFAEGTRSADGPCQTVQGRRAFCSRLKAGLTIVPLSISGSRSM